MSVSCVMDVNRTESLQIEHEIDSIGRYHRTRGWQLVAKKDDNRLLFSADGWMVTFSLDKVDCCTQHKLPR